MRSLRKSARSGIGLISSHLFLRWHSLVLCPPHFLFLLLLLLFFNVGLAALIEAVRVPVAVEECCLCLFSRPNRTQLRGPSSRRCRGTHGSLGQMQNYEREKGEEVREVQDRPQLSHLI